MTRNNTTGSTLRIRINTLPPPGEFDEFDLRRFRAGEVYDVPTQLASLLIVAGYAQPAAGHARAEVADYGHIRFPKPED